MARNLATTGVWGFESGHASSGATSILWTLLLALDFLLGVDPVVSTWIVNAALLSGLAVLFELLLSGDGVPRPAAGALAALPALLGNAAWLATTGLEPLLLSFLSVLSILLWRRRSPWTGVACGLAVLARPEGLGLGILLAALSARRREGRGWRDVSPLLVWVAAATAATAALSLATNGGLLPTTLEGRRWLYGIQGAPTPERLVGFVSAWIDQITTCALGAPLALAPLIAVPIVVGIVRVFRGMPGMTLVLAWAAVVNVLYMAVLPSLGHGGRYQPLNLLLTPLLAAFGIAAALRWIVASWRIRGRAEILAALVVAASCLPTLWIWRDVTRAGVAHIGEVHVKLAAWIRNNLSTEESVAAFDIGALAFFGGHRVVDLGGLVEREFLPYLRERRVPEFLRSRGVRYVALPMAYDETRPFRNIGVRLGLFANPAVRLERLQSFASSPSVWTPAFRNTGHASPRLTLYRVEFASVP